VAERTGARGRLVAFEGVDGCGKSTQARLLAGRLGARYTFEPGDTELGAAVRALLLGPGPAPSARTEALLMAADRAQHVDELIEPALAAGQWVVTDRYSGSTLAYQAWGRRLGAAALAPVLEFATGGLAADLSVLLEVPAALARERLGGSDPDRLEGQGPDFHARVAEGYRELARLDPNHWAVVDGSGDVDAVAEAVAAAVELRLGPPG
jgi:dTMP kinase